MRALEDACNVQVMAMAGGGGAALLQWAAVRRWMAQVDPGYMN